MTRKNQKWITVSERMQYLMDHPDAFRDLDDEEVSKGRLKDKNGGFSGRPPKAVPLKFHDMMRQELIRRWNIKVAETLEPSLKVLHEISQGKISGRVPADARMKSAIYLIERTVGKVPEKSEMQVELKPWQDGIEGLLYEAPDKE